MERTPIEMIRLLSLRFYGKSASRSSYSLAEQTNERTNEQVVGFFYGDSRLSQELIINRLLV